MRLRWTWKIGRIAGIDIGVHPSWLLIYALFAYSATTVARLITPELDRTSSLLLGLIASLILFASVVAHEFAHALEARRLGIPIAGITLFLFGGVASIMREAASPMGELRMAAAGPLLSFVLALVFGGLAAAANAIHAPWLYTLCFFLAIANALLAVFNLLPAFPMDGGRILRACMWMWQRSQARATRIASRISLVLAFGLGLTGIYLAISQHEVRGVWWIAIATFLAQMALTSDHQASLDLILETMTVGECMSTTLIPVPASTSVGSFIGEMAGVRGAAYPVLEGGRLVGLTDVRHTAGVPLAAWPTTPIGTLMTPIDDGLAIAPGASARDALLKMHDRSLNELPVFQAGELVGIVTQEAIFRQLHERRRSRGARV